MSTHLVLSAPGDRRRSLLATLVVASGAVAWAPAAQALTFAESPLFLTGSVKPNVLVAYDNSQSMDGTMAGQVIAGDDPITRGNIARAVLRSSITAYRQSFNWGLASFALTAAPASYVTYGYFFGSDTEVSYTNDCVAGVSASRGGLRCIANPQVDNGFNFLTYAHTGDDPSINDVLYIGADFGPQLYGIGVDGSTDYKVFRSHKGAAGDQWLAASFTLGFGGNWTFTPTDAGFLPQTPPDSRMFWLRRAWGFLNDITGTGLINEAVAVDSAAHYGRLMDLLAPETSSATTVELKNAALFTPLAGTLGTARSYFNNTLAGLSTPVSQTCQRNFVLLATDGNPTGRTDGSMYSLADQLNVFDPVSNTWTFSTAANEVFTEITGLRSTAITNSASLNGNYDVETYVIGLGDSVANASSIATLNRMAQLGGTNQAYLANDSASLSAAFARVANDIVARSSAAATVTLNSGSWSTGSTVYQARFNSGDWSGQLLAYGLNADGSLAPAATWDAAQRLNAQNWNTGRQILTYKGSAALGSRGVAFRWPGVPTAPIATELDITMVTALNTNSLGVQDGFGSDRLNWLRGNTSREQRNCTSCSAPVFRNRTVSVLGDIVNSAPVYVTGGGRYLRDTAEAAAYSAYKATRTSRPALVFAGANDGMLHAFSASTGDEVFAYVPSAVAARLSTLTDTSYSHRYSVDGPPVAGDVYYDNAWRTLLVSGMGAGAKGLFALDVSDPSTMDEAHAGSVVRWETNADADIGHIFHQPVLAKMKNGRWMAITGNGYNSSNGRAVLLLVDVETGAVTKLDTQAGDATAPNGLSGVVAVSTANNGVADLVYAGDLAGNVWKFDLSAAASSSWVVAFTVATLPQPLYTSAAGQPITARPDVSVHVDASGNPDGYMVVFGTGRYVDVTDNAAGSSQALYGIWDNGSRVTDETTIVAQSVLGTALGADGRTYRLSTHAVGEPAGTSYLGDNLLGRSAYLGSKRGWKLPLPSSGERIVTQASVRYGKVVVATAIPNTAPCSYGGDGWIMEVDLITGNRAGSSALDTNADNVVDGSDILAYDSGHAYASGVRVGSIPAAPAFIRARDRSLDDKMANTSAGTIVRVREQGGAAVSRRVSWEQLQ